MNIGVCIKQVAALEAEVALGTDGSWIAEAETYDSSESDMSFPGTPARGASNEHPTPARL